MSCSDFRTLLSPYLDGELDLVRQVELDDHLAVCGACSRAHQSQVALRGAIASGELYFRAPAHLEKTIRAAARSASRTASPPRSRLPAWIGAGVAAAAAVYLAVLVAPLFSRPSRTEHIAQDVVSAHIRSLMPGHLTDVPSSENHTIRPWFAGRLDFAPPVVDLSADGFVLVGARLDYAADRPVAALVYRKGEHVINLFIWPSRSAPDAAEAAESGQGYNLLFWTRGQTSFWAISDANATELRRFTSLLRARLS